MPRKILFPTDYSAAGNSALDYAADLARQWRAKLLITYVELPSLPPLGLATVQQARLADDEAASAALTERLDRAEAEPVSHEFHYLRGDPAAEIVQLAEREQVDLIVMATAGRSGWRRVLMGSVAEAVARAATCPVLSLREPAVLEPNGPSAETLSEDAASGHPPAELVEGGVAEDRRGALALLRRAVAGRATDVHLDPMENDVEVRFRIDGKLEHYCRLHHDVARPLSTQLKILAELDIADPFHVQEGRFSLSDLQEGYEVRMTRVPVLGGESIALRMLSRRHLVRPLQDLGLSAQALAWLQEALRLGEGVVLVTGPAGAGKTTTVYSMVHALHDGRSNIVTIEDPVEYRIEGFRQLSVDARHGVTMTSGLRSLLRMDPDIVLVGEVRDAETAEIAMRAASSGKYVFTTLHTRDVASTITALRDLHVDDRSLGSNLTGIVSERLVRRLCKNCCRQVATSSQQEQLFSDHGLEPPQTIGEAVGCGECRHLGYRERIGIFEVALPNREIREAIDRGISEEELRDLLRANQMPSLLTDGLLKVRDGVTTLDEIRAMTWVRCAG